MGKYDDQNSSDTARNFHANIKDLRVACKLVVNGDNNGLVMDLYRQALRSQKALAGHIAGPVTLTDIGAHMEIMYPSMGAWAENEVKFQAMMDVSLPALIQVIEANFETIRSFFGLDLVNGGIVSAPMSNGARIALLVFVNAVLTDTD